MSSIFINGAKYAISTAFDTALAVSAITNADPAVATTTAAPDDGSIVVVESGWPDLNDRVVRTANEASTTFELEGIDTTSTTDYPAGEGKGSVKPVSTWVTLSQVRNVEMAGGEQQYFQYQYVEDKSSRQRQKPTFKNAMTLTLTLDFDDSMPWYDALVKADAVKTPVVLRETLPNGAVIYTYGYPSFNKIPTKTVNENITVTATLSLISDPTRYAS